MTTDIATVAQERSVMATGLRLVEGRMRE